MATLDPHTVAQRVVDCVYAAVDHAGDLEVRRRGVVIGEHAWDDCQCGQLIISEQRRYPSRDFPLEDVDHTAECGEPWVVVELSLSLTRCIPSPDSSGNPPSIATLSTAAQQNSTDMTKTRRATLCCLSALYDAVAPAETIDAYQLGVTEVVGPLGGCAGFTLRILVGYTNDCNC